MPVPFRVPITTTCQYPVPCRGAPCGCPSAPIRKSSNLSKRASCPCPCACQSHPPASIRSPVGAPLVGAHSLPFASRPISANALHARALPRTNHTHLPISGPLQGRPLWAPFVAHIDDRIWMRWLPSFASFATKHPPAAQSRSTPAPTPAPADPSPSSTSPPQGRPASAPTDPTPGTTSTSPASSA